MAAMGSGVDVTTRVEELREQLKRWGYAYEVLEVRGEIYMPLSGFRTLNERLVAEGKKPTPNPRNAAAGSVRQKNPEVTRQMPLSIWVYGTGAHEGVEFDSHWQALEWLRERGFRTNPYAERLESIEEVAERC